MGAGNIFLYAQLLAGLLKVGDGHGVLGRRVPPSGVAVQQLGFEALDFDPLEEQEASVLGFGLALPGTYPCPARGLAGEGDGVPSHPALEVRPGALERPQLVAHELPSLEHGVLEVLEVLQASHTAFLPITLTSRAPGFDILTIRSSDM